MLLIPFLNIKDTAGQQEIVDKMEVVPENKIDVVNWPDEYPSRPEVSFKIAHNNTHLFLHYFVHENEILAETKDDNGPVWTDSCVEFFLSFDNGAHYYNAEFSCIGKALLGYRSGRDDAEHADKGVMASVRRYASLGKETFGKKQGDFAWNLLVIIPVSAYWKSGLSSFAGVRAKGNFYKCGDNLSVPHFLSWNPITTANPDFHRAEHFGDIVFE